jgi:hypothetical protein
MTTTAERIIALERERVAARDLAVPVPYPCARCRVAFRAHHRDLDHPYEAGSDIPGLDDEKATAR